MDGLEELEQREISKLTTRYKLYTLPCDILCDVLTGGVKVTNLPNNATVVGQHYRVEYNDYIIKVIHSSFDEVERGFVAETIPLLCEKIETKG